MGSKKKKRKHKMSSGLSHQRRVARAMRDLTYKINRFKRYQKEIEAGKRAGKLSRWDTSGMEKHLEFLGGLSCVGPKQR